MAFQGYVQLLCARGHYRDVDAYDDVPVACPVCGDPIAWNHTVDMTHGDEAPVALAVKTKAEYGVCNFGHKHLTKEPTYHQPQGQGD